MGTRNGDAACVPVPCPVQVGKEYIVLYSGIAQQHLVATDVSRQVYLHFETPDSPNNVIELDALLQP